MPYSPFTRFLAIVLVVLAGLALLWPDNRAYLWAWYGMASLPVLLAVFTWSAVRSAPPFDDSAFHRCLPPGDGRAFLRVIWIHLFVLAGVSVAVVAYCVIANFGWRAASYGIAMLTLPVWAFMSAVGIAASAASSRLHWKSTAWVAIFAVPFFSAALLYWVRSDMEPLDKYKVYFPPIRTLVLAAAGLYPLIWWLMAARRRRGLALGLGAATGALLPWLYVYGDFVKVPERREVPAFPAMDGITVSRKPIPEGAGRWIPVEDLLSVEGVPEGHEVSLGWWLPSFTLGGREYILFSGVAPDGDQPDSHHNAALMHEVAFTNEAGKPAWGPRPTRDRLRSFLPPLETLENWQPPKMPSGTVSVLNPAFPKLMSDQDLPQLLLGYRELTGETFKSQPWSVWLTPPRRWKLLGSCPADGEASFRLETGGKLKVLPLSRKADGTHEISLREYHEDLWQADGPWFGDEALSRRWAWTNITLVIVDESGKHGRVVEGLGYSGDEEVMLGKCTRWSLDAGPRGETAGELREIEALRKSRVYVFIAEGTGYLRQMELPPP